MINLLILTIFFILFYISLIEHYYPTRIVNPTRNMSYDLRCEPKIKKKNYIFMGSGIEPNFQHKCLDL